MIPPKPFLNTPVFLELVTLPSIATPVSAKEVLNPPIALNNAPNPPLVSLNAPPNNFLPTQTAEPKNILGANNTNNPVTGLINASRRTPMAFGIPAIADFKVSSPFSSRNDSLRDCVQPKNLSFSICIILLNPAAPLNVVFPVSLSVTKNPLDIDTNVSYKDCKPSAITGRYLSCSSLNVGL